MGRARMAITARIRALTKRTERNFKLLASSIVNDIAAEMEDHAFDAVDRLRVEPPRKAGSRYKRTHTARDSWDVLPASITRDGIVVRITNDATDPHGHKYAENVFGNEAGENQDPLGVLAPGWPLMAEEIRRGYAGKIRKVIHDAIEE